LKTFHFVLALTIAALGFAGCESAHESDPRTGIQFVQVATVQSAGPSERAFTGVVTARVQSNLGFRVPGKVVQRLVNIGDFARSCASLQRMPKIEDWLAGRDEFEPSDDLVSIAGVSVCTGVAFTVGRPRANWEVRDLIRQMSATNARVQIFRGG
jgi:hypothetical protein